MRVLSHKLLKKRRNLWDQACANNISKLHIFYKIIAFLLSKLCAIRISAELCNISCALTSSGYSLQIDMTFFFTPLPPTRKSTILDSKVLSSNPHKIKPIDGSNDGKYHYERGINWFLDLGKAPPVTALKAK